MSKLKIDELRLKFNNAFEVYTHEGAHMRDLLVALKPSPGSEELIAINDQQVRVERALRSYNEARQQYIFEVLGTFVHSR